MIEEGWSKERIQDHVDSLMSMSPTFFSNTLLEVVGTDHRQIIVKVVGKWDQGRRDILEECVFPWSFVVFYEGE